MNNMAEKQTIDYSNLSLPDVINRKIRRKATFLELVPEEKRKVFKYIKRHNIDIKIFGEKWYDILTKKFFAIEYLPSEGIFGFNKEKREFDSFEAFFNYVRGDIYENSCFYGYEFSANEIDKFSINLSRLNFDSFVTETIDDYSFESVNDINKEETKPDANRSKDIIEWFKRVEPVTTLEELEKKYCQFIDKFDFWDSKEAFFSMLLQRDKDVIKNAIMEFACRHGAYDGMAFSKVLLTYGREAALYVIYNFDDSCNQREKRRIIKHFKKVLERYDSGALATNILFGFDETSQLYYVKKRYYNGRNCLLTNGEFFTTFSDFVSFVNGDLSDADLSKAPISRKEMNKYKTNENTKFPFSKKYNAYVVTKEFADGAFVVEQKWIDEAGITISEKKHTFTHFFDFVHFLNGDLSDADLLFCDGIENIGKVKNVKLDGVKVRSESAEKLGLPLKLISKDKFETKSFESTGKHELETVENFLIEHPEDDDYSDRISYITDIHLLHRFGAYKCKTLEDINYVIRAIAKTLGGTSNGGKPNWRRYFK